jgi:DNA mismatch repair protein MutS2
VSHALRTAERLGLDAAIVEDARARVAPERLRVGELLSEAEAAARAADEELADARRDRAEAARAAERAREREGELARRIESVQAGAAKAREEARAEAERELADARAELDAMRDEIRAARRRERERRRSGGGAEAERDRRLGAAVDRASRAEQSIRSLEPLPVTAPLAAGDPVEAPDVGVRGTIAAIEGDTAEVVGAGGLRVRIPVARLRPTAERPAPAEPAVRVLASARGDVSDELDVRGMRAQEARERVRSFVDEAALAGLSTVRVVHGRGTGAVRQAVRSELSDHRLVERHEPDAEDGATTAYL